MYDILYRVWIDTLKVMIWNIKIVESKVEVRKYGTFIDIIMAGYRRTPTGENIKLDIPWWCFHFMRCLGKNNQNRYVYELDVIQHKETKAIGVILPRELDIWGFLRWEIHPLTFPIIERNGKREVFDLSEAINEIRLNDITVIGNIYQTPQYLSDDYLHKLYPFDEVMEILGEDEYTETHVMKAGYSLEEELKKEGWLTGDE